MTIDEKSMKKNIKAFTKMAEEEEKLKRINQETYNKLEVNAKRKQAILTCHMSMFSEKYSIIRKIQFAPGKGLKELAFLDNVQKELQMSLEIPALSGGVQLKDSQIIIALALGGIGRLMVMDSQVNQKIASKNMAQADAYSAQIDSMCIALEGIGRHIEIVTNLLEKLGMLYMKMIKQITFLLEANGMDGNNYSDEDIEALNLSLITTKVIYGIINTPMIDSSGTIMSESMRIIKEGQDLLERIEGKC